MHFKEFEKMRENVKFVFQRIGKGDIVFIEGIQKTIIGGITLSENREHFEE